MESRPNPKISIQTPSGTESVANKAPSTVQSSHNSLSRSVQSHERLSYVLSNIWSRELSGVSGNSSIQSTSKNSVDSVAKTRSQLSKASVKSITSDKQPPLTASQNRLSVIRETQIDELYSEKLRLELKESQSYQFTNNPHPQFSRETANSALEESASAAESVSAARTRERLLKLHQAEVQHSASEQSVQSATSSPSAPMAQKSFLHGLFGKWTKQNNPHSVNSLEATSTYSLLSSGSDTLPMYRSAASERSDVTLAEYRAIKVKNLDEIFAKAALSSANLAAGDRRDSDAALAFPSDMPPIYNVLLGHLENDMAHDKLVPFILRRFMEFGHERQFLDHLMTRIRSDEETIQHLCTANAFVLTEASRDFVDLNDRIDQLREDVVTLDDRDVYAAQLKEIRYAEKETRLTSCVLSNLAILMERINALRPALRSFSKALELSATPVKALRCLCKAQEDTVHLSPQMGFVAWLATTIPEIKYSLLETCTRGVIYTLEAISPSKPQAGLAMFHTVSLYSGITVEPAASELPKLLSALNGANAKESLEKMLNLRLLNNFRHIVKTLVDYPGGVDSEYLFHCYVTYMAERHVQIFKNLDEHDVTTLQQLRSFVQKIVGIFGMEMFIAYYVTGITAEDYYNDLWKDVFPKVRTITEDAIKLVCTENDYKDTRILLRIFLSAMAMLRCDTSGIFCLLESLAGHYCKILDQTLGAAMHLSLSRDLFSAHILSSVEAEKSFLHVFDPWEKHPGCTSKEFPKKLPFSQSVPEIYGLLTNYISSNIDVDKDLGLSVEESLERAVEITKTALTTQLYDHLQDIFTSGYLLVKQYVQVYQNMTQLQYCLPRLERFIAKELCVHLETNHPLLSLRSANVTFEALRLGTEQQLIGELTFCMIASPI
ncbi:exocyst complex component 6-like isoform X2 [Paramacrobiotus metropolitanus]|uniref:exocyst complex component 6-like isoform X2 n=1 Tax=Paramacrobiotus metropolitanus TaxID=2943436 RepID=UPI002445F255|nr:exocyst complex component 6-like isoform X2 [Paramacrobiotus metropolitanus]